MGSRANGGLGNGLVCLNAKFGRAESGSPRSLGACFSVGLKAREQLEAYRAFAAW